MLRIILMLGVLAPLITQFVPAQTNPAPFPRRFPPRLDPYQIGPPKPSIPFNNERRIDIKLPTFYLTTNFIVAEVETGNELPNEIALMVRPPKRDRPAPEKVDWSSLQKMSPEQRREALKTRFEQHSEWHDAKWMPYRPKLEIDLGANDGEREIWVIGRWQRGEEKFERAGVKHVELRRTAPLIVITSPTNQLTSQPMIQLKGYSTRPLESIRYDVINASNSVMNQQGAVNEQVMDLSTVSHYSTNFFSCYDIDLSLGVNTIILRCQDLAGNVSTNVLSYVFSLDQDKTPPVFSVDAPWNGEELAGESFTIRGQLDDPTAKIEAAIIAGGTTNIVHGLVERYGYFWIEHVPLRFERSELTITATDAAGNSSHTNLFVAKSSDILTVDMRAIPRQQLHWPAITVVRGTVEPSDRDVWVNGVQAGVQADGKWIATNVPVVSPDGCTVVFDTTAVPRGTRPTKLASVPKPNDLVAMRVDLNTNVMTLNATQPACGEFSLQLAGTAGRSFVLLASTNLVDWMPILTNRTGQPTFDYVDSDVGENRCRFFRVIPLP